MKYDIKESFAVYVVCFVNVYNILETIFIPGMNVSVCIANLLTGGQLHARVFASVEVSSPQEFITETWGWCSSWVAGAWEILNFSITPIIMAVQYIISFCANTQKIMMKMKFL